MKYLRAGSGLGDSIYLWPIAEYFIRQGPVTVLSDYPELFQSLPVMVEPFRRDRVDIVAHYTAGKTNTKTNQFEDMCIAAGTPPLALSMPWEIRETAMVSWVRAQASGRRIVLIHGGREPFNRTDGFGLDLMPTPGAFDKVGAALIDNDCFIVAIGDDKQIFPVAAHLNLNGHTSVADLFDLARLAHGIVAQCSFAIPLAEVLDKPLLAIWARAGLDSRTPYVRSITPKKILSKATSSYIMDDATDEEIKGAVDAFIR